jgi:hypothetical protein
MSPDEQYGSILWDNAWDGIFRTNVRLIGERISIKSGIIQMVSKIISSNIDYDETQKQLLIDICKI